MKKVFLGIVILMISIFIGFKNNNNQKMIAVYLDNEYSSKIPDKNSDYVIDRIVCDDDVKASWDDDEWSLSINSIFKKTKCNLYFRTDKITKDIIKSIDKSGKCPSLNSDSSLKVTSAETSESLLCKGYDNLGISYYYRGNITNNYVKFGKWSSNSPSVVYGYSTDNPSSNSTYLMEYDSLKECESASSFNKHCIEVSKANKDMYWRIVRINGDGSIRLVYDGTSIHSNSESNIDRYVGLSIFNKNNDDNAYLGYMYGNVGSSSYIETHKNINDSVMKKYLDNWYILNIRDTSNNKYIADSGFCDDRSIGEYNPNGYSNLGYGKNITSYRGDYGAWSAPEDTNNAKMTFKCVNKNDFFTVDNNVGNQDLSYSIGLLNKDEVILAGLANLGEKSNNYLYSAEDTIFWLMSPRIYSEKRSALINCVWRTSLSCFSEPNTKLGVKLVINLKPGSLKSGDGTASSPYLLSVN